ncbi:MAG: hypothetical protein B7Y48_03155, partial [Methylophilales bacterium 28-44-11]
MNLSIFALAYLGSQAKDTPHSGKNKILRYAHAQFVTETTDTQWMRQLGLAPQPDWPLAQLLCLAEALEANHQTSENSLILAQPVHLTLQRDSFGLESLITLHTDEYLTLTQHFNQFFVEEGLTVIPSVTQQYWILKTSAPWHLTTQPIQTAMHQNIQGFMPKGPDAQKLRQVMNQVQMLMHEHPINVQRVTDGLPEINSLWFSGNSISQLATTQKKTTLIGNSALIRAVSHALKLPSFAHLDSAIEEGVLDALMLIQPNDQIHWESIFDAVKSRKIKHLTLHLPLANGTLQVSLNPFDC